MTTKQTAQSAPTQAEDTPPWADIKPLYPQNPEAAWVAWGNWVVVVHGYDEIADEEYEYHVPMNVTIRDGIPVSDVFKNVEEFARGALALGWKPATERQWIPFDTSKPMQVPVQQPVASSPLPPAAAPGKAWTPPGTPQASVQQQAQAHNAGDNTFIVDKLLVANKTTVKGEAYIEFRLKGPRYPTFGVRIWPNKLDEVLGEGWSGAPAGEYQLPAKYTATFSWDEKPDKEGNPKPKTIYALEKVG